MGAMAETETAEGLAEIEAEPPESTLEDTLELADFPKAAEETSAEAEDEEIMELTDEDRASLEAALSTDDAEDSELTPDDEPTPDLMMAAEETAPELPDIQADDTVDSEQFVEAGTEDDILELSTGDTDLTDDSPMVASDEIESDVRTQTDGAELRPVEDEIAFDFKESGVGEVDDFGEVTVEPPAETVADFAEDTPQPIEAELTLDIDDDRPTQETAPQGLESETAQAEDEIRLDFQNEAEKDDVDAELSTDAVLEVTDEDESLEMSALTEEDEHGIESVTETEDESQIETAPEPSLEVDAGVPQPQDSQALAEDLGLALEEEQPSEAVESPVDEAEGDRATETLSAQNLFDDEVADESLAEKEDDFIESLGMTIETEMEAPVAAGMTAETQATGQDPTLGVDFDQTDAAGPVDLHKTADPISIQVKEHAEDNHTNEDELLSKVFQPETETAATPDNLEQTVERLVNKMFAEKIEVILVNAIERAVSKEIDRLKGVLLGELDRTD
jgi:hypothetical protein